MFATQQFLAFVFCLFLPFLGQSTEDFLNLCEPHETSESISACDSAYVYNTWRYDSGAYTHTTVSKVDGCDSTHTIHLNINKGIVLKNRVVACDSALVFGEWRKTSGIYTNTFFSSSGCKSVHEITLTIYVNVTTSNTITACDSAFVFGKWRKRSGVYTENYTSSTGCDSTHQISLKIKPIPDAWNKVNSLIPRYFTVDTGAYFSINLTDYLPIQNDTKILWYPPSAVDCDSCSTVNISKDFMGRISAIVTNDAGCGVEAKTIINRLHIFDKEINFPNAFSPNNDGSNDYFSIPVPPGAIVKNTRIFNRWGNLIQQQNAPIATTTSGQHLVWDGQFRGHPSPNGVYYWVAEVLLSDETTRLYKGEVNLIK